MHGGLGGEGTPKENTLPSGFQDPSGVLTALAGAITIFQGGNRDLKFTKNRKKKVVLKF
ncbi:hypothetical protein PL10110_230106 [Planktothrix agardhii]|nr:hypothetical protein PL10110_230106 [Planktothrix agardhii]